jgi:hypothetical protein
MSQHPFTEFSGVAGKVLRDAFSWRTLVTGLSLGFILVVIMFVLGLLGAPNVAVFVVQILVAAAMARFAINGLYGEWDGTMFSSSGGPWTLVMAVTGRYLFLTMAWLVPTFFLGLNQMANPQAMMMAPSMSGGGAMFAFAAYFLLSTLTPPIFMIAAVSAGDFGEFLSVDHWRNLFAGRTTDLFMVYAAYTGALGMAIFLILPALMAAGAIAWQLMALVGAIAGAFLFGLMTSLMGRLCGFYAYGDLSPAGGESQLVDPPHSPTPLQDRPSRADAMPVGPASVPISSAPTALDGAGDLTGGLPALEDARGKVKEAQRKFQADPASAIAFLEAITDDYAPHPQILHALVMLSHKTGNKEQAVTYGKQALPVCLDRGALPLAGEMFRVLWPLRAALDLDRDQLLKIAGALFRAGDLTYAANSYALVLQEDNCDARAIKGMMQVAETLLKERKQPTEAIKLYSYVLKTSARSPLVEYIQEGLQEAQKLEALARAS